MSTENQNQQVDITASDILNCRQIIKLAMERQCFSADELVDVSQVYAKLTAFHKDHEQQVKDAQENEAIATLDNDE